MHYEVAHRANFSTIRYAQCWEDADILVQALDVQPGHTCLSIASAGDNTLALLSRAPARVIALDLNPAQLACLELRVAAYRNLSHAELLELLGSTASTQRDALYARCRPDLSPSVRSFWDSQPESLRQGIGSIGKFERYLALFRRLILPLIHPHTRWQQLLHHRTPEERTAFYERHWNTPLWRLLIHLFCSRSVMGRLGRDPRFFAYAQQSVATHLLKRIRHALTVLDPAANPYLHWIMRGHHQHVLPYALRPENFVAIRDNLHRLEWRCQSLEAFLAEQDDTTIDRCNLSNIFEYMSQENYEHLLQKLAAVGRPGTRLAYWNMIVPRTRDQLTCHTRHGSRQLRSLDTLAHALYQHDKAFFYSRFVVQEVTTSC